MTEYEVVVTIGTHSMDDDVPYTEFPSDRSFSSREEAKAVAEEFSSFLGVETEVQERDAEWETTRAMVDDDTVGTLEVPIHEMHEMGVEPGDGLTIAVKRGVDDGN